MSVRRLSGLLRLVGGMMSGMGAADGTRATEQAGLSDEPPSTRAVWPVWKPVGGVDGDLFTARAPVASDRIEPDSAFRDRNSTDEPPFVLVEIRAGNGGLRLVGHTGSGRSLRGIFVLPDGQSVLARAGEAVGSEGFAVRSLELRRVRGESAAGSRARAVLARSLSGEMLTLETESSPPPLGVSVAVLRLPAEDETREVKEGERWEHAGRVFRIGSITLSPPRVEVTWTDRGGNERATELVPASEGSGTESPLSR